MNGGMSAPSLSPLLDLTAPAIKSVNSIIVARMQSEIELIPLLAGHLTSAGGKRIRPVIVLASAMMASDTADENSARLAASVELIHTATLLHDDVIDESVLRRGKKTANAIWGNEASVLVGDFLFACAFELMVEIGDMRVLGQLASASARITEGEIKQMLTTGKPETSIEDYLAVIKGKTAELFATAAETGWMLGGGDAAMAQAMRDYGMALGIVFQIVDDTLDYSASAAVLGKTIGDDFAEGKVTLPVIYAYQDGDEEERKFWHRYLVDTNNEGGHEGGLEGGDEDANEDADKQKDLLKRAQDLLNKHGAIERSLQEARRYADEAEAALGRISTKTKTAKLAHDGLIQAVRFAANRNS